MKILGAAPRIAGFQRFNNAWPPGPGTATRVGPIRGTSLRGISCQATIIIEATASASAPAAWRYSPQSAAPNGRYRGLKGGRRITGPAFHQSTWIGRARVNAGTERNRLTTSLMLYLPCCGLQRCVGDVEVRGFFII